MLLCSKSYAWQSSQSGHWRSYSQGNFKGCLFLLERRRWKSEGFLFSTKYRLSLIPAGRLEIPLILSFKSLQYLTHQKIKFILTQLYSWDFEAKNDNERENQDEEAIETIIEEDEEIEVVKAKKKGKP